jgi:hypothetical protein
MNWEEALANVKSHRGTVVYEAVIDLVDALIERRKDELLGCSAPDRFQVIRGGALALQQLRRDLEA